MPAHTKVYFYLPKFNFRKSSPRFGFATGIFQPCAVPCSTGLKSKSKRTATTTTTKSKRKKQR